MFTDYFKGKIRYRVVIKYPEKFLNGVRTKASLKEISVNENDELTFVCFFDDEKCVEQCVSKNAGKIISKKVNGFPKIFNRVKSRWGIIAGFSLSALIIFASTFFVWDIRVKGNETLADSEIITILKEAGLSEGQLIKNVDVKKIANRVLINEDRLSWIAINFEGTVATAEVKEAALEKVIDKKENVNIVASNNGIIMRVDALDGDAQVKKGDSVYKGQLLISSFSDKRTGGSILKGAKGFVWANTQRNVCVCVPLEYFEKHHSGNERVCYELKFLGKTLFVPFSLSDKYEKMTQYTEKLNMRLSDRIVLPFEVVKIVDTEYSLYKRKRTEKDAVEIAYVVFMGCCCFG